MSPLNPDRAVRQVVTDLAALHPEDVSAILDELGGADRRKIEALLREYEGVAEVRPPPHERKVLFDTSQFSPWLLERLEPGSATSFVMTEQAHQVLAECAMQIRPPADVETVPTAEVPARTLGRWFSAFSRNRREA